jgi:low affinity Fe/Cu permease
MNEIFRRIAHKAAEAVGSGKTFVLVLLVVIIWVITGPIFDYSEKWQLWINTITTIVTFLMVFLIQNSENRNTKVIQLKLDELIRAIKSARNRMVDLEDMSDTELEQLQREFEKIQQRASDRRKKLGN